MTGLTLALISKYFGFGDEHDCVVLDGGCVIGRIMLHPQAAPECPWLWTITDPEAEPLQVAVVRSLSGLEVPRCKEGRTTFGVTIISVILRLLVVQEDQ